MTDKDISIEMGPEGPRFAQPEPPPFSVPIPRHRDVVEVAPGIMVSQALIDEAVQVTSDPNVTEAIEQRQNVVAREQLLIKEDITASRQIIAAMVERLKNPPNMQERYVSYDSMPAPLQRVVKAYIDAAAANEELDAAIKALRA